VAYGMPGRNANVVVNDGRRAINIIPAENLIGGIINSRVSINDNGDVAFSTRINGGSPALVVGNGANLRVVAESGSQFSIFFPPAINNSRADNFSRCPTGHRRSAR